MSTDITSFRLSADEVAALTGYDQSTEQQRVLRELGIPFTLTRNPNPPRRRNVVVVLRADVERRGGVPVPVVEPERAPVLSGPGFAVGG